MSRQWREKTRERGENSPHNVRVKMIVEKEFFDNCHAFLSLSNCVYSSSTNFVCAVSVKNKFSPLLVSVVSSCRVTALIFNSFFLCAEYHLFYLRN